MSLETRPAAASRIICVPHAGGAASAFRHWPPLVAPDREVLGVQLPGRESRLFERPLTSMPELVTSLADEIEAWLDRPYALFGHSMGALIAFELARAIRRRGLPPPTYLFASACAAPHRTSARRDLSQLSDSDLVAEIERLRTGADAAMQHAEFLDLLLPALRADCALCATYKWQREAPLDCPIAAFGGQRDAAFTRPDLEAWSCHTTGRFDARVYPGDHFYCDGRNAATLRSLVRALESRLARGADTAAPRAQRPPTTGRAIPGRSPAQRLRS